MKEFESFEFSARACKAELSEFKGLLDSKDELSESTDLRPFLEQHRHLRAFIGSFNPDIHEYNLLAHEYDLFGDFACDFVVGDARRKAYTLIELEDAEIYSVFQGKKGRPGSRPPGTRHTAEWGARFLHGYSQIIDWFWKIDDQRKTNDFRDRFGGNDDVRFSGLLVIGRSKFLDEGQRLRLKWRLDKVVRGAPIVSQIEHRARGRGAR